MKKYDHLFFDLDNTLWDFSANSYHALHQTMAQLGFLEQIEPFDDFFRHYETINEHLWEEYRQKKIDKTQLTTQRFEQSLTQYNIHTDFKNVNDAYLELMPLQTRLFPDVPETLAYLKNKGYAMHIITNGFREVQYRKLDTSGLSSFFDRVVISEEIKAPKPEREIFEYALKSANARKTKSIMIGDSFEIDIVGAWEFGIDQIYFNRNEKKHNIPTKKHDQADKNTHKFKNTPLIPTHTIANFTEICQIL
jgi:putative hydrolase of the HAD superfamily